MIKKEKEDGRKRRGQCLRYYLTEKYPPIGTEGQRKRGQRQRDNRLEKYPLMGLKLWVIKIMGGGCN